MQVQNGICSRPSERPIVHSERCITEWGLCMFRVQTPQSQSPLGWKGNSRRVVNAMWTLLNSGGRARKIRTGFNSQFLHMVSLYQSCLPLEHDVLADLILLGVCIHAQLLITHQCVASHDSDEVIRILVNIKFLADVGSGSVEYPAQPWIHGLWNPLGIGA